MGFTTNYNLKKPADSDFYDVADSNGNMDKIDTALENHDAQLAQTVKSSEIDSLVSANSILNKLKTVDGAGSGLDADLLDGKNSADFVNAVATVIDTDPNTTLESYILTAHANSPMAGTYWHINTSFYSSKSTANGRSQIAVSYNASSTLMYIRSYYNNNWDAWKKLVREGDCMPILSKLKVFGILIPANQTDYTLFSYSGGPGRVNYVSQNGFTTFSFVIDGVTVVNPSVVPGVEPYGFQSSYGGRNTTLTNIEFKQSIVIKVNQTSAGNATGAVLTEK